MLGGRGDYLGSWVAMELLQFLTVGEQAGQREGGRMEGGKWGGGG